MANTNYLPPIDELLVGLPFGNVYPPGQPLAVLPKDGRTACLEVLAHHLASLRYAYPPNVERNRSDKPLPFTISAEDIEIEQPPPVEKLTFPSFGIVSIGEETNESLGLGTFIDETTVDTYMKGTALQRQSEHVETLGIEVWTESRPERRSIIQTIETGLTPTEQMAGIRFRVPAYYWQVARFTQLATVRDDSLAAQNRWRAIIKVELNFTVVALVRVATFEPVILPQTLEAWEDCAVLSTE